MGIALIFPRGAVEQSTELTISIPDTFNNFPQPSWKWGLLTPRVKIEPNDIQYKKTVYLVVNHNLQIALSNIDKLAKLVMLHRDNEEAEWKMITSNPDDGDQPPQGFPICREKQAVLTSSTVIIAMMSNCDQCLCYPLDDLSVRRCVMRMTFLSYADYHVDGGQMHIRTYAVHQNKDRIQEVMSSEQADFGGHFLGRSNIYVDRNGRNLRVCITLSVDREELPQQEGAISYMDLCVELDQRTGPSPYISFIVDLTQNGAAAHPRYMKMEARGAQCELGREASVISAQDIKEIVRKRAPQIAPEPDKKLHSNPISVSVLGQHRDDIVKILRENLSAPQIELITKFTDIRPWDADGHSGINHIILNIFVGLGNVVDVLDKLRAIGISIEVIEPLLRELDSNCPL